MTDNIDEYGLFALPADIRAKRLVRVGMTEDEYRVMAQRQIDRNKRWAEAEARGETVHGWSKKSPNPGWSDDKITGEVVPFCTHEPSDA